MALHQDGATARLNSLLVALLVCIMSGTMTGFSAYSTGLTTLLGSNADTIGAFGDFGVYTGFMMGMLYDRCGLGMSMSVSTCFIALGYFVTYLMTSDVLIPTYNLFQFTYFVIGQGSFGFLVTALSSQLNNFKKDQRTFVGGALLSMYAYSGVLWTIVYLYLSGGYLSTFYKIMGITALICGMLALLFMRDFSHIPPQRENSTDTAEVGEIDLNSVKHSDPSMGLLKDEGKVGPGAYDPDLVEQDVNKSVPNVSGFHLCTRKGFWLMFGVNFVGCGVALMWKNVMGSFANAFFFSDDERGLMVYVWAFANGSARIIFGYLADYYASIDVVKYPRVGWMVLVNVTCLISHLLFFVWAQDAVWLITVCSATMYGATYAIIASQMGFYFGTEGYGLNVGLVSIAIGFGDLMFVSLSTQFVNKATSVLSFDGECHGEICFFNTFVLSCSCLTLSLGLNVWFMLRDVARSQRLGIKSAVNEAVGH